MVDSKNRKGRGDKGKKRPHYNNSRRAAVKEARALSEEVDAPEVMCLAPRNRVCPRCHDVKIRATGWVKHHHCPEVIVCSLACARAKLYKLWVAGLVSIGDRTMMGFGKIEAVEGDISRIRLNNGILAEVIRARRQRVIKASGVTGS